MGASKLGGRVADVGWKFTEVASSKVQEVSGTVSISNYLGNVSITLVLGFGFRVHFLYIFLFISFHLYVNLI